MSAAKTFLIPAHLVDLAIRFLHEHAAVLQTQGLEASSHIVTSLSDELSECVALQVPQTPEQQAAVLTELFGCGPTDDSLGNRGQSS